MSHFKQIKKDCESRKRLVRAISSRHNRCNRNTIINVSKSLILSKLFYGIEITATAWENLISVLAPIYNGAVRSASGLLPSSPTISACVEAGLLPFDRAVAIAIVNRMVAFAEKTSGEGSHLVDLAASIYNKFTGETLPAVTRLFRVGPRSWKDRIPTVDLSLHCSIRAGDPPGTIGPKFRELALGKYKDHQHLFTDGSKSGTSVGFGIFGLKSDESYRLPNDCSVFSAEAAAISFAACRSDPDRPTVIFSDSLSVLQALDKGDSKHPYVQSIEQYINQLMVFCWVPGHSGIIGNSAADRLACLGRQNSSPLVHDVPGPDIRKLAVDKITSTFNDIWYSSQGYLRKIKDQLGKWTDRASHIEQRVLSRLRVGHTRLSHSHYLSGGSAPLCEVCCTVNSVEHFITNCRKYEHLRHQHNIPNSIRDALSNDPSREEALLQFLRDTELFGRI